MGMYTGMDQETWHLKGMSPILQGSFYFSKKIATERIYVSQEQGHLSVLFSDVPLEPRKGPGTLEKLNKCLLNDTTK